MEEKSQQDVKSKIDDVEVIEVSLDDVPEREDKTKEPKNEKSQGLKEKVNELADKLINEKSAIKRILYTVKLQMVLAKIQREIDIKDIKEKYGKDRSERTKTADDRKFENREKIAELLEVIKKYEKRLKANAEYDYDSSKFAFKESKKSRPSTAEEYIASLRNSKSEILNKAADQIETTLEDKRYLEDLKRQYEEAKNSLLKEDSRTNRQNLKSGIKEKSLVTSKKLNIFDKIKTAWRALVQGLKQEKEQYDTMKSIKNMEKEERKDINADTEQEKYDAEDLFDKEMSKINEEYEKKMEKLKKLHKQKMEEIDRKANERKEEMQEKYADIKEQAKIGLSEDRRAKFLEDIHFSEKDQPEENTTEGKEDEVEFLDEIDIDDKSKEEKQSNIRGRYMGPDGKVVDEKGNIIDEEISLD